MEQFMVNAARSSYRYVDHFCIIQVSRRTKFTAVLPQPTDFPLYAYDVKPFAVLEQRKNKKNVYSDVLGIITKVGAIHHSRSDHQLYRQIRLKDESGFEAMVTLWGNQAESFDTAWLRDHSSQGNATMLIVGTMVSEFQNMLAFRATPSSRWFLNISIPEVNALYESLGGQPCFIQWDDSEDPSDDPIETTLDALGEQPLCAILKKRFKLNILITDIPAPQAWWFYACKKCRIGMKREGTTFRCSKCHLTSGFHRYRITVAGIDVALPNHEPQMTGHFIFWGESGTTLVGRSAEQLVTEGPIRREGDVPPLITGSIGRKYTIVAEVKQETNDAEEGIIVLGVTEAYPLTTTMSTHHPYDVTSSSGTFQTEDTPDSVQKTAAHEEATGTELHTPVKDVIDNPNRNTEKVSTSAPDDKKRKGVQLTKNTNKKSSKDGPKGQLFPPSRTP